MFARVVGVALSFSSAIFISMGSAQDKVAGTRDAAALHASLREVINTGADLFNLQGDYAGCYRLYQGSLIAIKPLLKPEMQTTVEKALVEAGKMPAHADRAHHLRLAIDSIRDQIKPLSPQVPLPPVLKSPRTDAELIKSPPTKIKP